MMTLAIVVLVILLITHSPWWVVAAVAFGVINGAVQIRSLTTKARESP
jgi:hypothetical protein